MGSTQSSRFQRLALSALPLVIGACASQADTTELQTGPDAVSLGAPLRARAEAAEVAPNPSAPIPGVNDVQTVLVGEPPPPSVGVAPTPASDWLTFATPPPEPAPEALRASGVRLVQGENGVECAIFDDGALSSADQAGEPDTEITQLAQLGTDPLSQVEGQVLVRRRRGEVLEVIPLPGTNVEDLTVAADGSCLVRTAPAAAWESPWDLAAPAAETSGPAPAGGTQSTEGVELEVTPFLPCTQTTVPFCKEPGTTPTVAASCATQEGSGVSNIGAQACVDFWCKPRGMGQFALCCTEKFNYSCSVLFDQNCPVSCTNHPSCPSDADLKAIDAGYPALPKPTDCGDRPLVTAVCAFDPYCCSTAWDFICAKEATGLSNGPASACLPSGP